MAEESSQQFTSAGNMSASSATVGKFSSVPPVRQASIRKSSVSQSSQIKYVYAGIGEQPLTQREFDENLKNLRNILSEVDGLLHGDMKNPENIKHCQQLLGFATSLRLPQEVKDKEIRSYPPVMQQLYQSVKNEGASVSTASQMAMAKQTATTMAQVINSDLRHEAILKDLQTMDIDSVYDKYYGVQHEQDMIAMAESHRKFMDLLDMPLDTPEQRAEFERKAAAQLEEEKRRFEQETQRRIREWEEIQRIKQRDPERGAELERQWQEDMQKEDQVRSQQIQEIDDEIQQFPEGHPKREALLVRRDVHVVQQDWFSRFTRNSGASRGTESQKTQEEQPVLREIDNQRLYNENEVQATTPEARERFENLARLHENLENNAKDSRNNLVNINARLDNLRNNGDNSAQENRGSDNIGFERVFSNDGEKSQSAVANHQRAMMAVDNVGAALQTGKLNTDASRNLNGMGRVASIGFRAPINNTIPSKSEQPSITDAMASLGNGNAAGDLDFGIVPGERIRTIPRSSVGRVNGFRRGGIARTNQSLDLGVNGLVSTTVAPKVPENAAESSAITTERATADNPIVTADNQSSDQRMVDLTATLGAKKENPLGKPVNLEETSDINLLNARSQQSQAMA